MKFKWPLPLFLCVLHLTSHGQNCNCFTYPALRPVSTDTAINDRTYREIRARTFSAIANGGDQAGSLATFGSFDPVAGNFKLNYTQEIPVGVPRPAAGSQLPAAPIDNPPCAFCNPADASAPRSVNSWFLNVSAAGYLVGNNIGVLFDNSKFNSATSIAGKLFIPVHNSYMVSGLSADALNARKKQLEQDRWLAKLAVWQELDTMRLKTSLAYAREKASAASADRQTLRKTIRTLETGHENPRLVDSLYKCLNRIDTMVRDSVAQQLLVDSLDELLQIAQNKSPNPDYANYGFRLYRQIDMQYDRRLDSLELAIPYQPYSLRWFALIGQFNRNTYYTFDANKPYADQIAENTLSVFNYGVEFNLIHYTPSAMRYLNAGLLRIRNNNIWDLNTVHLTRGIATTPSGDTTHILTEKWNVYTSPILEYMAWKPYVNYYYFFGKALTNQAIHLQAQAEFRDDGTSPIDLGLGYVFSFKNGKENALVNAEAFICFNDVFKSLPDQEMHFYNRNTIGLRFGLPVTLPANKNASK